MITAAKLIAKNLWSIWTRSWRCKSSSDISVADDWSSSSWSHTSTQQQSANKGKSAGGMNVFVCDHLSLAVTRSITGKVLQYRDKLAMHRQDQLSTINLACSRVWKLIMATHFYDVLNLNCQHQTGVWSSMKQYEAVWRRRKYMIWLHNKVEYQLWSGKRLITAVDVSKVAAAGQTTPSLVSDIFWSTLAMLSWDVLPGAWAALTPRLTCSCLDTQ